MTRNYTVAVVGATGAVGQVLLMLLAERRFPVERLHAVASTRSAGNSVSFADSEVVIEDIVDFDFTAVDVAFFSAGSAVSRDYAKKAAACGTVVIDNTSEFRYQDDVPLIVPEVNMDVLSGYDDYHLIANPNCSTIQMLVALAPLHRCYNITSIHVSTYQAVSGSGQSAIEELAKQSGVLLSGASLSDDDVNAYPVRIAFNALPHIDVFQDNDFTKEEMKMNWETKKILDSEIEVNATCVRVPVFYGHSEAVHITTCEPIDIEQVHGLLSNTPGVQIASPYPTVIEAADADPVWVGRIRPSLIDGAYGLNMWIVSDNLRKGAALNSVQIAEQMIAKGML